MDEKISGWQCNQGVSAITADNEERFRCSKVGLLSLTENGAGIFLCIRESFSEGASLKGQTAEG